MTFDNFICDFTLWTATASAEIAAKIALLPENVDEHFLFRAELDWWRMNFVIQYVHQPGRQEGHPPDGDHYDDLVLCQHMGGAIDVN